MKNRRDVFSRHRFCGRTVEDEFACSRVEGGLLLGLYVLYLIDNVLPRTAMASWADEFRLVMLCAIIPIVMIVIFTQAVFYWRNNQNSPTI